MITYNQIATPQDKTFLSRARSTLGRNKFDSLIPNARLEFKQAYESETNPNKKINVARRAANLVYTNAMDEKR